MCFYLRYRDRTSRPLDPALITLDNVRGVKYLKEWEEEHKDVEKPELNSKDWPKTIEAIEEWLRGCLGVTNIPLAYVIREEEEVPQHANDPTTNYGSLQDELIGRAPILDNNNNYVNTFLTDRVRVWELLSGLTHDHECWSYVRPAQRTRDGRMAFESLKGHYLGVNNADNMASKAENQLAKATYSGEKRRWNFERFVRAHIDAHSILEGLRAQQGHVGIDERSKVRLLLAGIKTRELDTVKARILSDTELRNDFAACVNLFQDFIGQRSSMAGGPEVNISAIKTQVGKE